MTEIGVLIRRAREAKGTSRRLLSEQTGIAQSTIQAVEDGTGNSAFHIVARLAEAVAVQISAYASDLPRHGAPVDSPEPAPPIQPSLQAGQKGDTSSRHTDQLAGGEHGTDTGTTARYIAALDARLTRFERKFDAIAERLNHTGDVLDVTVRHIEVVAQDFNEQAAQLALAADSSRRAAARALGAGVPKTTGQPLKQARRAGDRKTAGTRAVDRKSSK